MVLCMDVPLLNKCVWGTCRYVPQSMHIFFCILHHAVAETNPGTAHRELLRMYVHFPAYRYIYRYSAVLYSMYGVLSCLAILDDGTIWIKIQHFGPPSAHLRPDWGTGSGTRI